MDKSMTGTQAPKSLTPNTTRPQDDSREFYLCHANDWYQKK